MVVPPHEGLPYDSSLVGYWDFNKGSGVVAYDSSNNGNNGSLSGENWTTGKYANALNFNGVTDKFSVNDSGSLHLRDMTISLWYNGLNPTGGSGTNRNIVAKGDYWDANMWALYSSATNCSTLIFATRLGGAPQKTIAYTHAYTGFVNVIITKELGLTKMYLNGNVVISGDLDDDTSVVSQLLEISGVTRTISGVVDDVRIYNRALNAREVAALSIQPDSLLLDDYWNYKDPVTDNTMLLHVDSPNSNGNNFALVTCTNFFANKRLDFHSNNSATMNIWTNLGQPVFTTGVWNSENFTTTLKFDAFSEGELSWDAYNITTYMDARSSVYPFNVTIPYLGNQIFNFNTTQGYGFDVKVDGQSQGQISSYTFNNVTASHSVNVTSALLKYNISVSADIGATISPSGDISVNYGGYQIFTVQNRIGYTVKNVYVDNVDKGLIANYTFSNVTGNHVFSVTSEKTPNVSATPTPSTNPTQTPSPSSNPSPTPTKSTQLSNSPSTTPISSKETSQITIQTAMIATDVVASLIVGFALAHKKGYIAIEVNDEENDESVVDEVTTGDHEKTPDYSI